ncbi:MAG: hypothetical protein AAF543_15040 [Pseudomonadota bacterium]
MNDTSLDQAVIQTMNELMRASSDCAEFDPGMSAKFAAAAKDLGRDLGITSNETDEPAEPVLDHVDEQEEEDEFRDLLHLLNLQKKAVAAAEMEMQPKSRFGWLGLDVWSRW